MHALTRRMTHATRDAAFMTNHQSGEVPQIPFDEYQAFSRFLRSLCGIELGANKQYLVATRVRRILKEADLPNLGALTAAMSRDNSWQLRQKVIDAMTTNETFWFRDTYPFQYLAETILPELAARRPAEKAKIWSAACSSGQEPYSISMIFEETLRTRFSRPMCEGDILATDLSSVILDSAKEGRYDQISLARGLSEQRRNDFFVPVGNEYWQLKSAIRNRVRFRSLNLQDSFLLLGKFDVIFCRNVLIYFSTDLKLEIIKKIHASLVPGGYLFLGSSESITGLNDYFEMVNCNPGVAYRAKLFRPTRG